MKCIGIIGGTSWESTAHYYAACNEAVKERLGGLHSARLLVWSVDFHEVEERQRAGDWAYLGEMYADIAKRLEKAGAACLVIAANTMHKLANDVSRAVSIPVLHIADATAQAILRTGKKRVLFLGTRYTMEEPFLVDHLRENGLDIVLPDASDIGKINRVIFEELCLGMVTEESRAYLCSVIERAESQSIEGVILGCTELGMILTPGDVSLPLFDTTEIHVDYAVNHSLST